MKQDILTVEEDASILGALKATVYGNFFPGRDFSSIFSLTKEEIRDVIEKWEILTFEDRNVISAINDSINNLFGYPHRKAGELPNFTSCTIDVLDALLDKILSHFGKLPIISDTDLKFNTEPLLNLLKSSQRLTNQDYRDGYCQYIIDDHQSIRIFSDYLVCRNNGTESRIAFFDIEKVFGETLSEETGELAIYMRNNEIHRIGIEFSKYSVDEAKMLLTFLNRNSYGSKYRGLKYFRRMWIN